LVEKFPIVLEKLLQVATSRQGGFFWLTLYLYFY